MGTDSVIYMLLLLMIFCSTSCSSVIVAGSDNHVHIETGKSKIDSEVNKGDTKQIVWEKTSGR